MNIIYTSKKSKSLTAFNETEWPLADQEHYGKVLGWTSHHFVLVAKEKRDIIAAVGFKVEAGVAYIGTLIVGKKSRGKGVGKKLIQKVEEIAKEQQAHKVYLQTGKHWDAISFYQKMGYSITAELPNHYHHHDFVELTKFL